MIRNEISDISFLSTLSTIHSAVNEKSSFKSMFEYKIKKAQKNILEFQNEVILATNLLVNEIISKSAKVSTELIALSKYISNLSESNSTTNPILDSLSLIIDKSALDHIKEVLNFKGALTIIEEFSEIFQIFDSSQNKTCNLKPTRSFQSEGQMIEPDYSKHSIFDKNFQSETLVKTNKSPLRRHPPINFTKSFAINTTKDYLKNTLGNEETLPISISDDKSCYSQTIPSKRLGEGKEYTQKKKKRNN